MLIHVQCGESFNINDCVLCLAIKTCRTSCTHSQHVSYFCFIVILLIFSRFVHLVTYRTPCHHTQRRVRTSVLPSVCWFSPVSLTAPLSIFLASDCVGAPEIQMWVIIYINYVAFYDSSMMLAKVLKIKWSCTERLLLITLNECLF